LVASIHIDANKEMRSVLNSELCNYDSVRPQGLLSDITPFSELKQESYTNKYEDDAALDNIKLNVVSEMKTPDKKFSQFETFTMKPPLEDSNTKGGINFSKLTSGGAFMTFDDFLQRSSV
jgi:hypothetical protein